MDEFAIREVLGVRTQIEGYKRATIAEFDKSLMLEIGDATIRSANIILSPDEARLLARQLRRIAQRIETRIDNT